MELARTKIIINKTVHLVHLLIEIIKCLNGKEYLSGLGAKNYQQDEKFRNANIQLDYTNFSTNKKKLENKNLFSEASILDPIFNEGISKTVANLNAYNV